MADDQAWLEWRRGGITATDIADAAQGTYGGEYGVVARKLGLIEVEETYQMRRGHIWQPRIADAVHALHGLFVVGEETWVERDGDTLVRATVDGFLSPADTASFDDVIGVVEIKTRGVGVRPNRDRWFDQMQWQMLATGLRVAMLAEAVIRDSPEGPEASICERVDFLEVEADEARQDYLRLLADRLWGHVQAGTLPEPDAGALDDVKHVNATADADAEVVNVRDVDVARLAKVRQAIKDLEAERDGIEAVLRHRLGAATTGTADGWKVTVGAPANVLTAQGESVLCARFPEFTRPKLDRPAFKAEHPDVYAATTTPTGARRLTIKEIPHD